MKTTFPYYIAVVVIMLLQASVAQAQLTTGGDVAGGYLWITPDLSDERMKHVEGKGDLWLGYKAKNYDWRLSLTGRYKNVDGEKTIDDINVSDRENPVYTSTFTATNEKPFNLTVRYDFNWRQRDKSSYGLWTQYDYEHIDFENSLLVTTFDFFQEDTALGRFEGKEDKGHKMAVGYRGTTLLNAPGWVLKSSADVSLLKRKVNDAWISYQMDIEDPEAPIPENALGWEMNPDYTDYAFNAALHLTDTVSASPSSRLLLGGGVRFKGDGERFLHDGEVSEPDDSEIHVDTVFIDQRATGFRFFVEPFVSGEWLSGKWLLSADYGLRLYHMSTTDKTGHAVQLYNYMNRDQSLSGNSFSHFTPLVAGNAKLTYTLSKHHRLSLANSLSNRFPTNRDAVLCFVQMTDFNKVYLGNPHLRPEVRMQFALDHTLTSGPFSATTGVSLERVNNQMEYYFYGCVLEGRNEIAQITLNVADVTTCRVSETFAWNNKWLKASATLWKHWAHHHGIGNNYSDHTLNDDNWGWRLDARATLGRGWLIATNFQFMGGYKTLTTQYSRRWQSSSASIEKRLGPVTLYLNADRLIDPASLVEKYDTTGNLIYLMEARTSNRIVMLGCRWSL